MFEWINKQPIQKIWTLCFHYEDIYEYIHHDNEPLQNCLLQYFGQRGNNYLWYLTGHEQWCG